MDEDGEELWLCHCGKWCVYGPCPECERKRDEQRQRAERARSKPEPEPERDPFDDQFFLNGY